MTIDLEAPPRAAAEVAGAQLTTRLRRLRRTPALRSLVRETRLHPSMLVAPLVRPAGPRHPRADRIDARRRAPVARRRRRGSGPAGRARCRRRPPVRPARTARTRWARRRRPTTGSSRTRSGGSGRSELPLVTIADTCLCEYTDHGHCGPLAADGSRRQRCGPRPARRNRRQPGSRGGRHRGAERDDGRPGRCDPGGARRRRVRRDGDHGLRRQARLGLLRPVPRSRRQRAGVRRPAGLPDGPGQRPRGAPRDGRSTSPRARTSCWSSRRCPAST